MDSHRSIASVSWTVLKATQLAMLGYIVNDLASAGKESLVNFTQQPTPSVWCIYLTAECPLLLGDNILSIAAFLTPSGQNVYSPLRF
jgi:hypothetical protein